MKLSYFLSLPLAPIVSVSAFELDNSVVPVGASITLPRGTPSFAHSPRSDKKPKKDNWGNCVESDRRKITIRASKSDTDDISADFLWALKQANHGGLVHLEKGKKYVIGKKLDLTFLNDVYVRLDGELKVSTPSAMEAVALFD